MKDSLQRLVQRFCDTRALFETLCQPLELEDYSLQATANTSPPKWHLAHTTWFFETFLLKPFVPDYKVHHPTWEVLFNSYYNGIGEQYSRPDRGLLSRPTVAEVYDYRHAITAQIVDLLQDTGHKDHAVICERAELGIHHEQQHQELFFTDIKYSLSRNPLNPSYALARKHSSKVSASTAKPWAGTATQWTSVDGGLVDVGFDGDGFCFDNELPRHKAVLPEFDIANRLVTNGEFADFILDGGYQRPEFWLADGWAAVQEQQWTSPLYWRFSEPSEIQRGQCRVYSLYGLDVLDMDAPVYHVSGYEADAYARWANCRLPTEPELEHVQKKYASDSDRGSADSQFYEAGALEPLAAMNEQGKDIQQLEGCLWAWTSSSYAAFPGFKAAEGAIGEYNGKFMCNQLVLKGGSFVTSQSHYRPSYRNFFYPADRWQFTGIRLARDA